MKLFVLNSLLFVVVFGEHRENWGTQGYNIQLVDKDSGITQETRMAFVKTFLHSYPLMARDFNKNAPRTVRVTIDPAIDGVAYAVNDAIFFSGNYVREHPEDVEAVSGCELAIIMRFHVVQQYNGRGDGWLVEGLADWARYKYGRHNKEANWSLPDFDKSQHYTNAYRVTARFLVWLEKRKTGTVRKLDRSIREGKYSKLTWKRVAGGSVDELWAQYARDPRI